MEIYSSLWLDGPADARLIAQRLEMDELSVYYHLRRLESVGLLRKTKEGAGSMAVYGPGERVSIDEFDMNVPANRSAMVQFVEAILRSAGREYSEAVESLGNEVHDRTYAGRSAIRLASEDRVELFDRLRELSAWIDSRRDPNGERLAITIMVAPVSGG
jgi:hypothetical protein